MSKVNEAYCGIGPIPKGRRRGTAKECLKSHQVRYYGLSLLPLRERYESFMKEFRAVFKDQAKHYHAHKKLMRKLALKRSKELDEEAEEVEAEIRALDEKYAPVLARYSELVKQHNELMRLISEEEKKGNKIFDYDDDDDDDDDQVTDLKDQVIDLKERYKTFRKEFRPVSKDIIKYRHARRNLEKELALKEDKGLTEEAEEVKDKISALDEEYAPVNARYSELVKQHKELMRLINEEEKKGNQIFDYDEDDEDEDDDEDEEPTPKSKSKKTKGGCILCIKGGCLSCKQPPHPSKLVLSRGAGFEDSIKAIVSKVLSDLNLTKPKKATKTRAAKTTKAKISIPISIPAPAPKRPHLIKGSPEAKAYMAELRARRKKRI